jgi:hypothetical protein
MGTRKVGEEELGAMPSRPAGDAVTVGALTMPTARDSALAPFPARGQADHGHQHQATMTSRRRARTQRVDAPMGMG